MDRSLRIANVLEKCLRGGRDLGAFSTIALILAAPAAAQAPTPGRGAPAQAPTATAPRAPLPPLPSVDPTVRRTTQPAAVQPPAPTPPPVARQVPAPPGPGLPPQPALPPAIPNGGRNDELEEVVKGTTAEINVIVGRSKILDIKRAYPQVLIANPAIADVTLIDREDQKLLNLHGHRFGTTTLTLFDSDPAQRDKIRQYLVRVTIDSKDMEQRLSRLFPGSQVTIQQAGTQIILEGQVPDSKMMAEILQLVEAELTGSQDAANAGLAGGGTGSGGGDPNRPPGAAADLNQAQVAGGDPNQQLPPTGTIVERQTIVGAQPGVQPGTVAGAVSGVLVRGGGGGLAPGTIINRVHIPGPRQVLLKVKIAELNRTALREVGVNFERLTSGDIIRSTIGGVSILPPPGPQLVGIFDDGKFSLFINALRRNNLAKLLAEPNLVALDGQPARFQSGGKVPYPVAQGGQTNGGGTTISIQFENFGAILEFVPHILANDVIRLDVEPVFSQPDFALGTSSSGTTVPGFRERRARTVVEMREGQTLAIAGLLQTTTEGQIDRIPLLGDIPFFGTAFSRNTLKSFESELVVLVTPVLVAPAEAGEIPPAPGDRVLEPNDFEFYLLGRMEGKTGHPFRSTVQYLDPFYLSKHFKSENQWVIGPHGHAD